MRITELFTAQSIALDEAQQDRSQIIDRLVELQATHGNIRDKEAYKKGLYERENEGSTYVDNGITVPHAKCDCVTRPSLAALRLKTPVQYNAEDDGKTDLLFAIAAPKNGSLHVDMLARMMQMLMNEDFVEKLRTAKTPEDFLAAIDAQEEAQFGDESFTDQEIEQAGCRVLAVTACVNGIAHTYMAAEALNKAGAKMKVLIIGGVAGGATAAARLRRLDESAEIVILERSGYVSYANCGLPYYIGGVIEKKQALTLQTKESFWNRFHIDVRLNNEALSIDRERKTVRVRRLLDGSEYEETYDKLILSPGAKALRPPLPGIDSPRIFTLRTVEDTFAIREQIERTKPENAVVPGLYFPDNMPAAHPPLQ